MGHATLVVLVAVATGCGRIGFDPTETGGSAGPVVQLAVGASHACTRDELGVLLCWGDNDVGQLGLGDTDDRTVPVPVAGEHRWMDVALGKSHTCGIDRDGHAWCWGANVNGELGLAPPTCDNTTIDAGETCDDGNTANGDTCPATCRADVATRVPQLLPDGRRYTRIFAASSQTCAVAIDNTLWCWGRNGAQELGVGGNTDRGKPTQVVIVAPQVGRDDAWASVGPGDDHTCAVQIDGSLWCFGANGNGELGQGGSAAIVRDRPEVVAPPSAWSRYEGGLDYGCALGRDTNLACWGRNDQQQLGLGDTADRSTPAAITGSWAQLGVGATHACAIRADQTLWCWGDNTHGELAVVPVGGTLSSTQVSGTWAAVTAGSEFTCALDTRNAAWCWGWGANGQLGSGGTAESAVPLLVASP